MSKILVLMSDNRSLENDFQKANYNSLVAAINYEYCKTQGYDFIYYKPYLINKDNNEILNCKSPHTQKLRHSAWAKILSMIQSFDLNYDYFVYIDSDCIFKDFNKSLDEFIYPYPNKDIYFLNNKPWCNQCPLGGFYPCSGFYICRYTDISKKFMYNWYKMDVEWYNENHPWEQHALWQFFYDYNQFIEIIDSWMFKETEDQFLRHIGICEGHNRIPYFANFIQSKNIDYVKNIKEIKVVQFDTDKYSNLENLET
jgi:hypothetical protein